MQQDPHQLFEHAVWPHWRGAYNLARWLVRNDQDAEEVVQESFVKAFRNVHDVYAGNTRAWLFTIVRNTAFSLLQRRQRKGEVSWEAQVLEPRDRAAGPETRLLSEERRLQVRTAIQNLPEEFREPLVLRELEGLSYKEIAWVLKIPMGTVMSRLSRARGLLLRELSPLQEEWHDLRRS